MSKAKGTVHIRVTGTVPLVNFYLAVFWSDRLTLEKKRNRKNNCIKTYVSAKLFRLQIFRSGLFAETFLDRTSQRDSAQQLEPISTTDTLPG